MQRFGFDTQGLYILIKMCLTSNALYVGLDKNVWQHFELCNFKEQFYLAILQHVLVSSYKTGFHFIFSLP